MSTLLTELGHRVGEPAVETLSDRDYIELAYQQFAKRPSAFRQQATLLPEQALTAGELDALRHVGLAPDADTARNADRARQDALHAWFEVYRSAHTTADAARLLGVHPSRIRQRLKDRTLIALDDSGELRIPSLLFEAGGELPGLRRVLPAIAVDVRPLEILSWLATPTQDLQDDEGRPRSPRDFLLATGDADRVIALAEALGGGEAA
ncbi:MAG: hypothetical protein LW860_09400 [Xanthomonadaceae bacterium]|jgi:hypothetical protein|nr:hypothetical protein [Xanthomonadaceae bacterium]